MRAAEQSIAWVLIAAGLAAGVAHRPYVAVLCAAAGASWLIAGAARRHPALARLIVRTLLVPHPRTAPRVDRLSAAIMIGLLAAMAMLTADRWRRPPPLSPLYDDHTSTSLNIAVTRSRCGVASAVPDQGDVAMYLSTHPQDTDTPLRQVAAQSCNAIHPLVIGENTLMLIEAAVLRIAPEASLATIGRVLMALQFAGIALLLAALVYTGMPLVACALVMLASATLTEALADQYTYAIYPLMIPSVGAVIGILTLAPRAGGTLRHGTVAAGLGVLLGAIGNLRTDLLLVCGVLAAIWMVATDRSRRVLLARALGITAGLAAFSVLWIRPINQAQPHRLTGHPVMHPIVLALAIPENRLATELGLTWNDTTAFDLAHRLQPGVHVLTPDYEAVLRRFYFDLWRDRPAAMLNVYRQKLAAAALSFAVDNTGIGFDGQLWRSVLRPVGVRRVSAWIVPLLFALAVTGGLAIAIRFPASWALPATLLFVAGAINWLESVVIFSHFTPQYYAIAFLAIVAGCIALYQAAVQCTWWPMTRRVFPPIE